MVADVTQDPERIIAETINKFSKLDVLVNNVGIVRYNRQETLDAMEAFDENINSNVRSVLALTKLAVPHLEKTKGNAGIDQILSIFQAMLVHGVCQYLRPLWIILRAVLSLS